MVALEVLCGLGLEVVNLTFAHTLIHPIGQNPPSRPHSSSTGPAVYPGEKGNAYQPLSLLDTNLTSTFLKNPSPPFDKYTHSLSNKYFWCTPHEGIHHRPGPYPHYIYSITRGYGEHKEKWILKRHIYKWFIIIEVLQDERSEHPWSLYEQDEHFTHTALSYWTLKCGELSCPGTNHPVP